MIAGKFKRLQEVDANIKTLSLYLSGSDYVTYNELENSTELTLTVHFVGEPGQVTRLFPQNILRGMGYPLDIQVTLKVCTG